MSKKDDSKKPYDAAAGHKWKTTSHLVTIDNNATSAKKVFDELIGDVHVSNIYIVPVAAGSVTHRAFIVYISEVI